MPETQAQVIAAAKQVAQDVPATPLLGDPTDYTRALTAAIREFDQDVPNKRIVHYTVTASSFRFILAGTGAIVTGLDAWTPAESSMSKVWHPYDVNAQGRAPLEDYNWAVYDEPSQSVLEFLVYTPTDGVLRLEYVNPHVVDATTSANTTVSDTKTEALHYLTAVNILEMYAARTIQNTGNTGLMGDVVDRRTPSDQAQSRAKMLYARYCEMVGRSDEVQPPALSSMGAMNVRPSYAGGFLFKPRRPR